MTIAIVGTNGFLGKAFLETFQDPKFNTEDLIIVSRDAPKDSDTDKIKYYNYSDLDKVVQIASTLIVLGGASPEVFGHFYNLLSKPNNIKVYVPSTFGYQDSAVTPYLPGVFDARPAHVAAVRELGIKTVTNTSSLFAIPGAFLYEFATESAGLHPETGELKVIGDIKTPFAVSGVYDIARSLATALNLDDIPDDLVYYSDVITPEQVVDHYIKKHPGFEIKKKTNLTYEEALAHGRELTSKGYDPAKDFTTLLHIIASGGVDKGISFSKSHRELLNPNESKWKWFSYEKEQ